MSPEKSPRAEPPRRVRYCATDAGTVWIVIAEFGDWIWMRNGDERDMPPTTARCSWVEDVINSKE